MKLAAIDIGSNAIRLQIVNVFEETDLVSFKKLEYMRFPLRLGKDVFNKGKISDPVIERYNKLMKAFKLLLELYEVQDYYAVATSAMREAKNGEAVRNLIHQSSNIDIHIVSGDEEASILNKSIRPYLTDEESIHIDVGGGSTELNVYTGKTLIGARSFKIGTVRKLSTDQRNLVFEEMARWIKKSKFSKKRNVIGIGTGGNINKLFKLSRRSNSSIISLVELKAIRAYVKTFSYAQRISILKMNQDRADVIIPASEIYIRVLEMVGADQILVPKVGLKDGIIYEVYERTTKRNINQFEYLKGFD